MNGFQFNKMGETIQGLIIVATGVILLFYTLDLLGTWINALFICAAVGVILYGLIKLNLLSYWNKIVSKVTGTKNKE